MATKLQVTDPDTAFSRNACDINCAALVRAPAPGLPDTNLRPNTTFPVHAHVSPSLSAHLVHDDAESKLE